MRLPIIILLFTLVTIGCDLSYKLAKKDWTVQEVKEMVSKHNSTWHSLILYRGSDDTTHYFIYRIMDEWSWIHINKNELTLEEEHLYHTTSNAPFGYYYVDVEQGFKKTIEYGR